MVKKILIILLAVALLAGGCAPHTQEEISQPESSESSLTESEAQPEERNLSSEQRELYTFLAENFPRIDGSTSLIPLEAGVRAEIFGKSIEEAQKDVAHSTTWGSFDNLLNGRADLIFSTPISEQQRQMAKEAGVELEQVPVVKEAFVFVVNAQNPVDALSQQQIKDIYSGKITNWKQLGGNDEPIIAYQRNTDSGSQNYMIDFMGETPLTDAPTELRPGSMSGLVEVIAPNDGAAGSIGYSVYAYAADMHGKDDNIKFVAVDGVAPTKESIISGEYPLSSYNYAIFSADEPEDGAVRRLVNWMTDYDGQLAIAKAGYATVEDIGFDYSQSALKKYAAVGTGMKYPGSVPSYEYDVGFEVKTWFSSEYNFDIENNEYDPAFISDTALRSEVSEFVKEAVKNVSAEEENMLNFIEESQAREADHADNVRVVNLRPTGVIAKAEIKNGYLSVCVSLSYFFDVQDCYDRYYRTETAVWDLISGKRLAPEELFYEGVDIAKVLNECIGIECQRDEDRFIGPYRMKADFAGLTENGWHITANAVYFDNDNPYFAYGYKFSLENLPEGIMVTEQPRAAGSVIEKTEETRNFRRINRTVYGVKDEKDDYYTYELLYEDSYPGAKKINAFVESYVKEHFDMETVQKYFAEKGVDINDDHVSGDLGSTDCYLYDAGGKYIFFITGDFEVIRTDKIDGDYIDTYFTYPYARTFCFDSQTGEQVDWRSVLKDGWEEKAVFEKSFVDGKTYHLSSIRGTENGYQLVYLECDNKDYGYVKITVPDEYINW